MPFVCCRKFFHLEIKDFCYADFAYDCTEAWFPSDTATSKLTTKNEN